MEQQRRPTAKGITRDRVVDAAWSIIQEQGAGELSMRKLAAAVGVQPTTVYWHVGNRDAVIDAVVDRALQEVELRGVAGGDLPERLCTMAASVRSEMNGRPQLLSLLATEERLEAFFVPLVLSFLTETEKAGFGPEATLQLVRALLIHVVGFVLVERQMLARGASIAGAAYDQVGLRFDPAPEQRRRDLDALFEVSVRTHVHGLLARIEAEGAS